MSKPRAICLRAGLDIVNLASQCRLDPFLIPTGFRAITFEINGREITTTTVPNLEAKAFGICITGSDSSGAVDVSLSRLCGLGGLGGSSRTTTSGTAVVVRGLAGSSAATVAAGGLVRRGSLDRKSVV